MANIELIPQFIWIWRLFFFFYGKKGKQKKNKHSQRDLVSKYIDLVSLICEKTVELWDQNRVKHDMKTCFIISKYVSMRQANDIYCQFTKKKGSLNKSALVKSFSCESTLAMCSKEWVVISTKKNRPQNVILIVSILVLHLLWRCQFQVHSIFENVRFSSSSFTSHSQSFGFAQNK